MDIQRTTVEGPKIGRLMVASDLAPRSDAVVDAAIHLALAVGAAIEIVHVEDPIAILLSDSGYMGEAQRVLDRAERAAEVDDRLTAQTQRARDMGAACIATSLAGRPAEEIVGHAQKSRVGLIVVGVEKRWRVQHLLRDRLGITVATQSGCPVLLIPI